ncbi:YicC/YloC family endoribonuclease [Pendulispora albinea]|uniref:YicC family protein n=1 Tax=Pendulispora albinea TaxID=2741071 RepID=A0ABZ2M429_9BACT
MRSMTGFGAGDYPLGAGRLGVEIRALNHRFLDVRVRIARELGDLAGYVEQLARERLTRGRFEVTVRVDGIGLGLTTLDRERAKSAYRALCELRDEIAPGSEVPLSLLGAIPDLFVSSVEREMETTKDATRRAFELAVASLDEMREREGTTLAEDLGRRLAAVRDLTTTVTARAPELLEEHRRRLRERTERLRSNMDLQIDAGRLETEVVLFAERVDISEELTRLISHCSQFIALLEGEKSCGRRLDFLLQEMVREANTAGAKSPDAQIAHAIVEMKAELERMREQVQNVE